MSSTPSPEDFGLTPNTPVHKYQDVHHFSEMVFREFKLLQSRQDSSQYVIFTDLDQERFSRDFQDHTDALAIESYFPRLQILMAKIETVTHANAADDFGIMFMEKPCLMKIDRRQLIKISTASIETDERSKRADRAYKPRRLPKYRDQRWPTLVVEVGYTEVRRKLANDTRWWLTASNGDVKTVVTISINQKYREITFEKWGPNTEAPEQPVVLQSIQVQQDADLQHIKISGKCPLVLSFEAIFLRHPQTACETDIEFSQDELEKFAVDTWDVQAVFSQTFSRNTSPEFIAANCGIRASNLCLRATPPPNA
ncbi:hypothetical protein TSTA_105050 [Talaromyces stipitatus ATCC 10500]|uniref:Uncharacterized protein n=1 Tax=Talaromyces stipitatus (strain ATCC 10500 / CBS 375.48 / QM 6759 / NRRL 1006) TaxID=441959 RepID=B8MP54_TALSN|nr:uncharacterized protein TSTA_105050 [Talaromyces stipitatus ATCC 10500]EED14293.1 hypothetical protein TSTA_105050 [Talaromyces stipitatus ATCC 10500]